MPSGGPLHKYSYATNGIEPPRGQISIKSSRRRIGTGLYLNTTLKDTIRIVVDLTSNEGILPLTGHQCKNLFDKPISA